MTQAFQDGLAYAERLAALVSRAAAEAGGAAWPVAAIAAAAGVALLLAGVRLGPALVGIGGGALAWVASARLPLTVTLGVPPWMQPWIAAAVVALACAFVPVLYPILLGAVPGALLGASLLGRGWVGALGGAAVLGVAGLLLRRVLLAATAAVPGALLVVGALVALTPHFPSLHAVTGRPVLLATLAGLLAVAGTAAQAAAQARAGARRDRGAPGAGGAVRPS